ncbi:carbon-nitrogen hydrolase family protein [Denitrobaculum tricleocarpae]|nr:carbon-nitrogen hydrolase family protein [Denitrobaculum tricleocarpae]
MKRVALSQMAGVPGDIEATMARVLSDVEAAAREKADLLIFPEGIMTGYYSADLTAARVPDISAWLPELQRRAKSSRLAIIIGALVADGESIRNLALAIDEEGELVAQYCKRALYGKWEQATFTPGECSEVVVLAGIKTGLLICYDIEFPELTRQLAQAGAELIATPTALMAPSTEVAQVLVPARAIENQIFVAYCNRVGQEEELDFLGLSSIVAPDGKVLARAGGDPALILADLDLSEVGSSRSNSCYLDDLKRLQRGEEN